MDIDLTLFGRPVLEGDGFALLVAAMTLNMVAVALVVGGVYFRQTRDKDHAFMMVTLNLVVFLLSFLLNSVELGVGFGFGLFAIFGIVRYRTEAVPVREMSFLFVAIALALTNAVGARNLSWSEVVVANVIVIVVLAVLTRWFWPESYLEQRVVYDRVELLPPRHREQLLADLTQRTGMLVVDVEVRSVNLINDSAELRIKGQPLSVAAPQRSHTNGWAPAETGVHATYPPPTSNGATGPQGNGGGPVVLAGHQGSTQPRHPQGPVVQKWGR